MAFAPPSFCSSSAEFFTWLSHVLLITAVVADTGILFIAAVSKISAPALGTGAVVAAMPANANALANPPVSYSSTERVHHAGHFMPRNPRIGDSWPPAFNDDRVAAAYAACQNLDAHLCRTWIRNLRLDNSKPGSGRGHLCGSHRFYGDGTRHNSSPSC